MPCPGSTITSPAPLGYEPSSVAVGKLRGSPRRPQSFEDQRCGPTVVRLFRGALGRGYLTQVIVKELGERALPNLPAGEPETMEAGTT